MKNRLFCKANSVWLRQRSVACALLMILGNATAALAQQGADKEIIVVGASYVPAVSPMATNISHACGILRAHGLYHADAAYSAYSILPANKVTLYNLRTDGDVVAAGPIQGIEQGGRTQAINLNIDAGDNPPSAAVHSVLAEGTITMNGPSLVDGKYVYGDVAESVAARGALAGDVVIISPAEDLTVEPSTKPYDTRVAGVISTEPKLYLGPDKTKQPLALAGVVLCKASVENGPIKPGDLLVTSSQPGHAMRADSKSVMPGMLVGRALEPLAQGTGSINILINQ